MAANRHNLPTKVKSLNTDNKIPTDWIRIILQLPLNQLKNEIDRDI